MNIELLIEHEGSLFSPPVEEGISWSTERKGSPGQLTFKIVQSSSGDDVEFAEGDHVRVKLGEKPIFYGFIFTLKRDKDNMISVTAYDQLRYLKNKDTYVYENKTASEVIKMIASDFNLQTGTIEDTKFKIPSRVETDTSLFDIIQNALDATLENKKEMYVMYDDFGKITLKNIGNMKTDVLIDKETAENFDYSSSIDSNTYNKIKLTYDNKETGTREVYIAKHGQSMNRWGVLQYFESLDNVKDAQKRADGYLKLYNQKTKSLSVKGAFGDLSVRAGSLIPVMLNLGDVKVQNYMVVEKCKHQFTNEMHLMDLTLRGGEFVA